MAKATKTLRMEMDLFSALDSICERHGDVTWHIEKALRSYGPIKKALGQAEKPKPELTRRADKGDQVGQLPLPGDQGFFAIYQTDIDKWAGLYPGADISQELRNMYGWLDANPSKRKTAKGLPRFINSWLSKAQNNGQNTQYQRISASGRIEKPKGAIRTAIDQADAIYSDACSEEAFGLVMEKDGTDL